MDAINLYAKHMDAIDAHYAALKTIVQKSGEAPEGNCLYYHNTFEVFPHLINKRANLLYLASQTGGKVAEIGLNAGHSAVLLAFLSPSSEITFFDLAEHAYVPACFKYLQETFPNKMTLVTGDSRKTLPPFASANLRTFDLVHVDGGHQEDVFRSDLEAAIRMTKVGGVIIADDTNISYINELLNEKMEDGILSEIKGLLYTIGYEHRAFRKIR